MPKSLEMFPFIEAENSSLQNQEALVDRSY